MDLLPCCGSLARVDLPPFGFPNGVCAKSGRGIMHTAARPVTVECFFDYSSPRTYLGFHQLHEMRARYPNVAFVFRPMLVRGIFNSPWLCEPVCVRDSACIPINVRMPMPMWMWM